MNNIVDIVKKYSLYIISTLLVLLLFSYCSKVKYKNLNNRYLIESAKKSEEFKKHLDSIITSQTTTILLLEKEYDSSDSTIISLKNKLNVSE